MSHTVRYLGVSLLLPFSCPLVKYGTLVRYYTPSYTLCRSSHVRFHYYPFIIVNFVLTLSHSRDQRTRLSRLTQNPCALVSL